MRRDLDAYFTPTWAAEQLLDRMDLTGTVVEPCVGEHAIAAPLLRRTDVQVITNDLDRKRRADLHEDAAHFVFWHRIEELGGCDWVVSNPPFVAAVEILKYAWTHARCGVALLLRLSFLEPCDDRGSWLEQHPPTRQIVLPRISFTGDGNTDSVTCAWFIWEHGKTGSIEIVSKRTLSGDRAPSLLEVS